MSFKRLLVLTLAALIVLGLAVPAVAQNPKSITIAFPQEPDSLNPMYTTMTFAGYTYQLFLAGAWEYDADLAPYPMLVTEIPSPDNGGINEDGTVITLRLRDDIRWSDGEPITSADFVFTYEMYMSDANSPLTRSPYDKVASVEAPNATTVVITFNEPYAPWLALFSRVLPMHVLQPLFETNGTIDNAEWNRAPLVGSGPYVFDTWEIGSFIRFVRNENYYNPPPLIDTVVVSFIPDEEAYLAALKNGDADVGTFIAFSDIPELEETGFLNIALHASGYNEGWIFNLDPNTGHPALQDVNVRRALALAFDRWKIDNDLLLGYTFPPSSYWENTPYDNPDLEPIPYDPVLATQLLDEAGWVDSNGDGTRDKDGVELVLRYVTNQRQIRADTQVVVQQDFAALGIGIEIVNHPSDIFFNSYADGGPIATGQYDIAQWSSSPAAFPDPETYRYRCSEIPTPENPIGDNWQGYCNEEMDALFAEEARTTDYDARVALFHQIDQIIHDEVIWVGVWYDADVWIVNNRVLNTAINGATPFWNINQWDVAE